ncbi:MAG: glycosyltransferase [Proteobacteria bacterium]|nr:glycosyltransferase [Pseudomonadota bacterium]
MDVAVVIPALNEADNVPDLVAGVRTALPDAEIVLVDNGSTDGTAASAASVGATVLSEPNRGYGSACQRGIRYLEARDPRPDVMIILDADRADDPGFLVGFVDRIARDQTDFVLSSRTRWGADPGAMTWVQLGGNLLQTIAINTRFGTHLTDMGPMRAIRFDRLLELQMSDPTWGWNVEMACKAARQGLRIVEVPVTYRARQAGTSKISGSLKGAARAGTRILQALWQYAR